MNPSTIREILAVVEKEYHRFITQQHLNDWVMAIGIALLSVGIACFIAHLLTSFAGAEPTFDKPVIARSDEVIHVIVATLLTRSQELRMEARQFITFIFLLAIGGIGFFHFAGELSYESRASERGLFTLARELSSRGHNTQEKLEKLFRDALTEASFMDDNTVKTIALQSASSTAANMVELVKSDASSREINIHLNRNVLISSIVARAGIVLIVAYLIRILLASYRYTLRLATFYSSRAYSLTLVPADRFPKTLAECVAVLGPESLEFENASPDELVESAAKLKKLAE